MNTSVTSKEFMTIAQEKPVAVLDLRDPVFFEPAALPEPIQTIHIPLTELPNRLGELDKETTYYVFTQFGGRSKVMTRFLADQGFQVVNVIGGTTAYQKVIAG